MIVEAFAKLPTHERRCIAVLALWNAPINRTRWAEGLRSVDVRAPKARATGRGLPTVAISSTDLSGLARKWTELGVVTRLPDDRYLCSADIAHAALTDATSEWSYEKLRGVIQTRYYYDGRDERAAIARAAIYDPRQQAWPELVEREARHGWLKRFRDEPLSLLHPQSPAGAIALVPDDLRLRYVADALDWGIERGVFCGGAVSVAESLDRSRGDTIEVLARATTLLALAGRKLGVEVDLESAKSAAAMEALVIRALVRGEVEAARGWAERCWACSRGASGRKQPFLEVPTAPLITVLLATGPPEQQALAAAQQRAAEKKDVQALVYRDLQQFLAGRLNPSWFGTVASSWSDTLGAALMGVWSGADALQGDLQKEWRSVIEATRRQGLVWVADQLDGVLAKIDGAAPPAKYKSLLDLYRPREPWERTLDAIEAAFAGGAPKQAGNSGAADGPTERLVWRVRVHAPDRGQSLDELFGGTSMELASVMQIEPRLQKRGKRGWTSGRPVALSRLAEQSGKLEWLTGADLRVAATIRVDRGWYGNRTYYFSERAPLALVGHPHVFSDLDDAPIEVSRAQPSLRVTKVRDRVSLEMYPASGSSKIMCEQAGPRKILVYEMTEQHHALGRLIGAGLDVPALAEARLSKILELASGTLDVQSDVAANPAAATTKAADSRPVFLLSRASPGLRVELCVCPLGLDGPRLQAGAGGTSMVAQVGGELLHTQRELETERRNRDAALAACPSLSLGELSGRHRSFDDDEDALEALLELGALGDEAVLAWPKGQPIRVSRERSSGQLSLSLRSAKEWFTIDGSVEVDESEVVALEALLDRLPQSRGRFVPLGDDRHLALTRSLLARLRILEAARRQGRSKTTTQVHAVVASLAVGWADELGALDLDKRGKSRLRMVQEAADLDVELPRTFEAELRAYQRTGFEWLARLAHWGAGACLADDMGLGKTIQALGLLVRRAPDGPALVIAPTSVCANWEVETARFAPSLRTHRLTQDIDCGALGPFDVLVGTYTMMTLQIDALAEVRFSTVVLDEAQAVKNPGTRRTKAALRLQGDFRVATTGTPVENRVGDLHSIMSFLNPGLLGSKKAFETRFARPIQRDRSADAAESLRALVRPFMLRRAKRDVLHELPARTEVVVTVEPTEQERAFYEVLRRKALERFDADGAAASRQAMHLLADITRLRRAACHAELVEPGIGLPSSKLEQLVELLHELIEGGHRMLVFSQFVGFLTLVKARLDEEGVSYQYLDGSTPERARRVAVDAFQAGDSDAFLISLKAGGTGLNLTAADYVIHLDPWWNPAVEDQASDRAHRIGQRRPVTVYRLVTRDSIEARVIDLHRDKRDLAEQLLAETATPQALDAEALVGLLRGSGSPAGTDGTAQARETPRA